MSYVKIWVHAVWGTKWRHPFLEDGLKAEVMTHIIENARKKGIEIIIINGWVDHLHCLIRLDARQCIADVVKLIKGEISHWINQKGLTQRKFRWAKEYYAGSVSERNLHSVKHYIKNQERHHSKRTFEQEVDTFFKEYAKGKE